MKPLTVADILDVDTYATVRDAYRARVIAHKNARRVAVGDRVTLTFEDRETVRYQIQEMTRIEQTRGAEKVQAELDAYNELIPAPRQLSATLFIEITELGQVRPELDRLLGIDECVSWVLGEGAGEESIPARFDPAQMEEERISAVHYIRFEFEPEQIERILSGDPCRIRIDHPHYRHSTEIESATRQSLADDLRGTVPSLLDPASIPVASAPGDEVLEEQARIRVVRAAPPVAPGHLVVEPVEEVTSLVEAEPELLATLLGRVRELADEMRERTGGCRVWTDVEPAGQGRLRWHLVPRKR